MLSAVTLAFSNLKKTNCVSTSKFSSIQAIFAFEALQNTHTICDPKTTNNIIPRNYMNGRTEQSKWLQVRRDLLIASKEQNITGRSGGAFISLPCVWHHSVEQVCESTEMLTSH